ncbi:MAG: YbfB/YjiJ family MFS transporter [Variovorax sp.]|nr:YbfB/YjiJ family MFS transporter [Variovorax sp.]
MFAGLSASLVGIGLARFAYSPLIPTLIDSHWFEASDVIYLGAANLAGYLVGALSGRPVGRRIGNAWALRLMMALATLAFLACAVPLSTTWFFGWRLLSGVAGGVIMVLVASTVLPHVPGARKGLAAGAIFMGLGLGIAGSGTLVPLLLELGLREAWLGLGLISAVLTALSWTGWPKTGSAPPRTTRVTAPALNTDQRRALLFVNSEYALMAIAVVPTMVFLSDFIARGLGKGAHAGAIYWVLYGAGAIVGPMVYGALADRLGSSRALRFVLLVQALAVAALVGTRNAYVLGIASVLIGTFPPGAVPLVLARVHHELPNARVAQDAAWSRATTVFALFQALAGYAYSYLFTLTGQRHSLLFAVGGVALVLAWALDQFGSMIVWPVAGRDVQVPPRLKP